MSDGIAERDWKLFRRLREVALERFCRSILDEVEPIRADDGRSFHRRYLDLYRLIETRDEEIADCFNDPRRSRMILQLAAVRSRGLITDEEFAQFGPPTREQVDAILDIPARR